MTLEIMLNLADSCYSSEDIFLSNTQTHTQTNTIFPLADIQRCRSHWPRGLRHELSSSAQRLGSCVRIPLEAWMSVCVYSVFVLSCVQVAALRRTDSASKESYRLCKKVKKLKKAAKVQQRAVEL
jgi:hypothetical protein